MIISLFCFMPMGCFKFPSLIKPARPQTHYNWKETKRVKPKFVVTKGDKVFVVEDREETITAELIKTEPKLTFMQRVGRWIGGLTFFAIVLGLVCPGALGVLGKLLYNRWRNMRKALSETVRGIQNANLSDKSTLDASQSDETKEMIAKIKSKF
jgi:hypothetical protein